MNETALDAAEGFAAIGIHLLPADPANDDPAVKGRLALWCRFADSSRPMKMDVTSVTYDPADGLHRYQLRLTIDETDKHGDWDAELLVDGVPVAVLLGTPPLSVGTHMAATIWDARAATGDIPPLLDVLAAPVATMQLRGVAIPQAPEEQTCGPGASFYSLGSPIVSFEAAVGRAKSRADVTGFREIVAPCVPCIKPCDRYMCDPTCPSEQVTRPFVIDGLALEGFTELAKDWHWSSNAPRSVNASTIRSDDVVIVAVDAAASALLVATLVDIDAGVTVHASLLSGVPLPDVAVPLGPGPTAAGSVRRVTGFGFDGDAFAIALFASPDGGVGAGVPAKTFLHAVEHAGRASLVAHMLSPEEAVHLKSGRAGYTRGPTLGLRKDLAMAVKDVRNWQHAAESFEPLELWVAPVPECRPACGSLPSPCCCSHRL